ncbi:hypothetical protein [Parachitinimonas caeni]|uniref:Uncharacterized protein n=1 Tax=Parachitinimonas caeni TaxID=3031301 RepID=A0ABT7DZ77_9NEIS|nr:hypothetical protein [Parachitinimonas caeni]MDK2125371.1 hypothetical protein [Parachitinimonas caeni]
MKHTLLKSFLLAGLLALPLAAQAAIEGPADFGNLGIGTSKKAEFTVSSNRPRKLGAATITSRGTIACAAIGCEHDNGALFNILEDGCKGRKLRAGETCSITVEFRTPTFIVPPQLPPQGQGYKAVLKVPGAGELDLRGVMGAAADR